MKVIDSCSLINILNGGFFQQYLKLNYVLAIGNIVYEELTKISSQKDVIDLLIAQGNLNLITDDVNVETFINLKRKYQIGDGETECICLCLENKDFEFICDDKKARTSFAKELSNDKLTGTIGILREIKLMNIDTCKNVFDFYLKMRRDGAFLPSLGLTFFCPKN